MSKPYLCPCVTAEDRKELCSLGSWKEKKMAEKIEFYQHLCTLYCSLKKKKIKSGSKDTQVEDVAAVSSCRRETNIIESKFEGEGLLRGRPPLK